MLEIQRWGIGVAIALTMLCGSAWAADMMKLRLIFATPYSTNYTPFIIAKDLGL